MTHVTRLFSGAALVSLLGGAFIQPVLAQSAASLTFSVVDASKAYVPDAEVHVYDHAHEREVTLRTNRDGIVAFPALAPGSYQFIVQHAGFKKAYSKLTLETGDTKSIRVTLDVGADNTTVEVNASDSMALDTDQALKTTITQQQVANLPLNGRTFQNLIAVTPGVSRTSGSGLFSFNGQRDNTNYFTLDGVAANTGITQSQGASLGQFGAGQTPSLSAAGTTSSLYRWMLWTRSPFRPTITRQNTDARRVARSS